MRKVINTARAVAQRVEEKVALVMVGTVLMTASLAQASKNFGKGSARGAEPKVQ